MANQAHGGGRQQFEPGPSFTDDAPGNLPVSELPSWLQSFAETIADDESMPLDEPAAAESPSAPATVAEDAAMPGWLNAPRGAAAPGGDHGSSVGQGFFSEDDLPDWLRALSSDEVQDETRANGRADGGASDVLAEEAPSRFLAAPAVSNVWVTGMEARIENPGASLFAAIASDGAIRPELALAATPRPSEGAAARGATRQAEDARLEEKRGRSGWSRRERILLLAVIIMSIVVLIVLSSSFGS